MRSDLLRDMSTAGLESDREACLTLTNPVICSDRVIEFHADMADRISDEIDRRNA